MSEVNDLLKPSEDCSCEECQSACKRRPGWFLPGEAEKAAELLGLSFEEFFEARLAVDWWCDAGDTDILVLGPALVGHETERCYPPWPTGRCTFYKEGRCEIHAAKPTECRAYHHAESEEAAGDRHEAIARAWQGEVHQAQCQALLGDERPAGDFGLLGGFLNSLKHPFGS